MKSASILLVEDDQPILEGISDLLSVADIGYSLNVDTAQNGVEALECIQRRRPDLIISDIMMPRMDGYELLARVRENPDWVRIPFILATARGEKDDIHRGRTSGAQRYVTKPFKTEQLLELIKSQLDRQFQLVDSHKQQVTIEKSRVFRTINHELRTPLTFVTAYFEILAESVNQFEDPRMLHEYLQGIQLGCVRLGNLIDDLITIMDLRTGTLAKQVQQEMRYIDDMAQRLQMLCDRYQDEAAAATVVFTASIPDNLPPLRGAPIQLLDAIERLLSNAVKFTDLKETKPQQIHVSAYAEANKLIIEVEDTGIGFPAHLSEQIFDFLFQYNREYFEQQGSGSGLAIARGIVQLHGGTITATGSVDQGAKFTVTLPTAAAISRHALEKGPNSALVLVVEDEENLLYGLRELLEISTDRYQMQVTTATNGQEGLDRIREHRPDLIVSDIMMPVMDGYDFLRTVRQNPEWVQIPFIFLTAKGERSAIHKGYSSGVEEYITKPYNSEELLELIHTQLDRHFEVQSRFSQDFEDLKAGILALLQPNFKQSVSAVNTYSRDLAEMLLGDQMNGVQERLTHAKTAEDLRESLQGIHSNSHQLTRQIEGFIALAELRAGEAEKAFAMNAQLLTDLAPLLASEYEQFRATADLENVVLHADLEMDLPPVLGVYDDLRVCQNRLLSVGLQLCRQGEGDQLILENESDGEQIRIIVSCNGLGFAPEQERIVSDLLRGREEEALELTPYGPQLLLVNGHVRLHGGELHFESYADQHVFTICLPVHC